MKKICLFTFLIINFKSFCQNDKMPLGEYELTNFSTRPIVFPYRTDSFCLKTNQFFEVQLRKNKSLIRKTLVKPYGILVITDSLGHFTDYRLSKYDEPEDKLMVIYINKVIKKIVWNIEMMKVEDFHDERELNRYKILLDISIGINNRFKVIAIAQGVHETDLTTLCPCLVWTQIK